MFGELTKVELREIWPNEASDFTPWLGDNIDKLGDVLGIQMELVQQEASVGDFSLDLLARNLNDQRPVIIENQLTKTDHDHLGKLITYAAGFGASVVIWIADSIREEHRQALEWLNQRTDSDTQFFGVVPEVLRIDDSNPAFVFKPVVFPNEWQKSKKSKTTPSTSSTGESYRTYFQLLIDSLREDHRFTGARIGQPQSWYSFTSGVKGILFSASFARGGIVRTEIYIDCGERERNKTIFDQLLLRKNILESKFGQQLEWERLDEKQASRVAIYRDGAIDCSDSELENIRAWHVASLLNFKANIMDDVREICAS
jgi:hypothetical protein